MKQWRNRPRIAALLSGTLLLAAGIPLLGPALGQDSPESLLPPGFNDPTPPPPAEEPQPGTPAPGEPGARPPADLLPRLPLKPPAAAGDEEAKEDETPEPFELPEAARRPVEIAGPLGPESTGLGDAPFGNADGRFLSTLMRRIDAPFVSRWGSIVLRRALLARTGTPRGVVPADWIAERAWLLLRMGEADGARLLVQAVDVDRFTPKLAEVAGQVALATADPAALCPLVDTGERFSKEPIWPLARGMCAGLSGEASVAGVMIDRVRQARRAEGVDALLAEKVMGAGVGGRRAINIQWDGVDRLTSWRFGLATAVAVPIPDALYASAGSQVQAWRARAPMLPLADRVGAAKLAASLGVFSNTALVDAYSALADQTDSFAISETTAGRLRIAYVGEDANARMAAIRTLWGEDPRPRSRYGAAILTARAAARIRPSDELAGDAASLIGSMLSAGLDVQAARWAGVVQRMGGAEGDGAWALLAVGAPRPVVDLSYGRLDSYASRAGDDGAQRARLLFAGLAGLGRLSPAEIRRGEEDLGVSLAAENRWTHAIELALQQGQPGTVALLAAIGLQANNWHSVPAAHLYRAISALRRAGLEGEARMIAAEAITRT